jgi:hypothetical protein
MEMTDGQTKERKPSAIVTHAHREEQMRGRSPREAAHLSALEFR